MDTPVLIAIFNRPDNVRALIDALEKVKPSRLFVAADGPRADVPTDTAACQEARAIIDTISWPCEIQKKYSEENLGLSESMEQAIDWMFEQTDRAIIFEDDCIPHPDFFPFVESLLEKYQDEESVMMISGDNFQDGNIRGEGSYYFSQYPNIWGWATWKRAWKKYDKGTSGLQSFLDTNRMAHIFADPAEQTHWIKAFTNPYTDAQGKKRLTWATTWFFSILQAGGISISPNVNLVQNIGFSDNATHTKGSGRGVSIKASALGEIVHPTSTRIVDDADRYLFRKKYKITHWKRFYNASCVILDRIGIKRSLKSALQKLRILPS